MKISFLPCIAGLCMTSLASATSSGGFPALIELETLDGTDGFVMRGLANLDLCGTGVGFVGDVNADGLDDIAVSAIFAEGPQPNRAGEVYVVFGQEGLGGAGEVRLDLLVGSNGYRLIGKGAGDGAGVNLDALSDFNGDGLDDFLIAAPGSSTETAFDVGGVYVLYGRPGLGTSGLFPLQFVNGANGFFVEGIDEDDSLGEEIAEPAGDVNGDGRLDLLLSAPSADPEGREFAGEAYVLFGAEGLGETGFEMLQGLAGKAGFTIKGEDIGDLVIAGGSFEVAAVPDINADGIDDVVIGAAQVSPDGVNTAGRVYVLFGGADLGAGGDIDLTEFAAAPRGRGFTVDGLFNDGALGVTVGGGDFNNDGIGDIVVTDSLASIGALFTGATYVVFGSPGLGTGGTFDLATLDGTNGFAFVGAQEGQQIGFDVSPAGDINGDGAIDLIVGQREGNFEGGGAYVLFGGATVGAGGSISTNDLDGGNGFAVFSNVNQADCGSSVGGAGDVNADGVDDLIVGCPDADVGKLNGAGVAYVVFGRDPDSDDDGIFDTDDNCIDDPNPDQRDTNADGYGNTCDADLNDDCIINVQDWLIMRDVLFTGDPDADLNGDDIVNGMDALMLFADRFQPPGPSGITDVCD